MKISSPISAKDVSQQSLRLGPMTVEGSTIYYLEGRPLEKGRNVLMSLGKENKELLPKEFDVRTKVHEYGGKCILAHKEELFFVQATNQQIYRRSKEGKISQLTDEISLRFADFSTNGNFLYAVAERHSPSSVDNMLVSICLTTKKLTILSEGYDFYASPRVSPDGKYLAWFCWNHPNMAWDATELWIGEISSFLKSKQKIAGGPEESILTPTWSRKGHLFFASDKTGYWNVYVYDHKKTLPLTKPCDIDFGEPHWTLGVERYCILDDETIVAIGTTQAQEDLYLIKEGLVQPLHLPISFLSDLYLCENRLIFKGGSPTLPQGIFSFDLASHHLQCIKTTATSSIDRSYLSLPQSISFPTEKGLYSHGFYYPPTHNIHPHAAPPLILRCHGGPTGHFSPRFHLETLFFTSRGFAVFEINYRGSSGYGRTYRNLLRNSWGIADVQDCIHAATYLCKQKLADTNRLVIKGSSAGGFTALCAMTSPSPFAAGVSYYGISDLNALAKSTHKMELHYTDHLIGPLPKAKALYEKRSPIHRTNHLTKPILFFQGEKDLVVLPDQSQNMYEALCQKNICSAYLLFSEEGHGFRQSATLQRCLTLELLFYAKLFHLDVKESFLTNNEPLKGSLYTHGINFS